MKDELPTPDWKNQIWKDSIANIDEHLNGWAAGSSSIYARDVKKHVWAMNEVQRFFIEETRLGIPAEIWLSWCWVTPQRRSAKAPAARVLIYQDAS
ncbi:MAG: hypothetical protein ACR2HX_12220 [Pyrinomonadaceae bacterium]